MVLDTPLLLLPPQFEYQQYKHMTAQKNSRKALKEDMQLAKDNAKIESNI